MAKKSGGEDSKPRKGVDITKQKINKAKRALKSGGKRGLERFLAQNADIRSNAEVARLIKQAATMADRPPVGKRGPAPVMVSAD